MLRKVVLIFSGFNQRAIIAFLRTLKKTKTPFIIVAKSSDDTIFKTEYKNNVVVTRQSVPLDIEDFINCIQNIQDINPLKQLIIAPSTEALNRFILQHKSTFEKMDCIIPLVDNELYENISNKWTFSELCKKNNIKVPKEYTELKDVVFPCVAKPKYYSPRATGDALVPIIMEHSQSKDNFDKIFHKSDFYFQEYVGGRSFYLLYYFHRNGSIYKFSQENLLQQPSGKSIVAAVSSDFHCSEESIKYENLFKSLNYHGFVMVEVKKNIDGYFMIEANPRFWGPSQLYVDANVNLFEVFLHDYELTEREPILSKEKKVVKYFWYGGIMEILFKGDKIVCHNYNLIDLINQLPEWLSCDIYRRTDTIDLFSYETKLC